MGYVWQQTRNVAVNGLVHDAFRDVSYGAERGLVHLLCTNRWYDVTAQKRHGKATYTKKRTTCLQCIRLDNG